ncbi:Usp domain-containing protein [Candidatus Nitrotoga sp. BS]|uniref:universal stress protein n=1 Tax=Candidatus Nitrotoga sp. BS TaxID=2890408 RepID=UPI001EF2631F|nr:universal stress protein [Candidatus Nitrotoga sp. BS]CAH1197929.1 Usp domain-containing protein [Candidatus Nitrotoga sp. BS]
MRKILIPCDGSDNSLRAVRYAASVAKDLPDLQLELLHVQDPILMKVYANLSAQETEHNRQADEADRTLRSAKQILDTEGVPYQVHWCAGSPANEIARHVHDTHCNSIIMGTRGLSPVAAMMIGSVATKVIHLVEVPVTLIK